MTRLNIIGCGKLGQSLARLWNEAQVFEIGSILNLSLESSAHAIEHIGAGTACATLEQSSAASVWLIATNDQSISPTAEALSKSRLLRQGDCIFHCSGAFSSELLTSCRDLGATVASVHPVMTFAAALESRVHFEGVHCGCEGDAQAIAILEEKFHAIGGNCFQIESENKTLYHAATVMCCNYLTSLTEASASLFEHAGIEREQSLKLMQPIMEATLANIFSQGTTHALTGPISRGDAETVQNHLNALSNDNSLEMYRALGAATIELARAQGNASDAQLTEIKNIISG